MDEELDRALRDIRRRKFDQKLLIIKTQYPETVSTELPLVETEPDGTVCLDLEDQINFLMKHYPSVEWKVPEVPSEHSNVPDAAVGFLLDTIDISLSKKRDGFDLRDAMILYQKGNHTDLINCYRVLVKEVAFTIDCLINLRRPTIAGTYLTGEVNLDSRSLEDQDVLKKLFFHYTQLKKDSIREDTS